MSKCIKHGLKESHLRKNSLLDPPWQIFVLPILQALWIGWAVWHVPLQIFSYVEVGDLLQSGAGYSRNPDPEKTHTDLALLNDLKMKPFPCSFLFCVSLLFSDVAHATYHLKAGDHQLKTAQSYAQTRHNAQPVLRTLNIASKWIKNPVSSSENILLDGRGFVLS